MILTNMTNFSKLQAASPQNFNSIKINKILLPQSQLDIHMKSIYAEILTIGDEILYGHITDTNSQFISTALDKAGIQVIRRTSVGDNKEAIINGLKSAEAIADIVIMTGGLGPTKDDITKKTLAEYFQTTLIMNEEVLSHIERLFASRGRVMNDLNKSQALIPANARVIHNAVGTAPGMWIEHQGKVFISMPGVPYEMKKMMEEWIVPQLRKHFQTPAIIHKWVKTINIPESTLAEKIAKWEDALPAHLKLAYLPRMGQVRLRLTGKGEDAEVLNTELDAQIAQLIPIIKDHVYGYEDDEIEKVVGNLLVQKNKTISTAESCTGGYMAHLLTSVAGSSRYFIGSIVAYSNQIKMNELGVSPVVLDEHGAVSEPTVVAMAEGIRKKFGTSIGLATSGIAGPEGGSPEKPVGTVWVAYADEKGTIAKKLALTQDRMLNITLTTNFLLNLLRMKLNE
jgi:nicotinamide-nucleotide amidase